VPDLAVAMPTPTDEGRTYTFQIRRGLNYSNGDPVEPADFRRGIERLYRLGGATSVPYFDVIIGAAACRARPAQCDLSRGIVTDASAGTVTIRLTRPDPNMVHYLALPYAHFVARSAPATEVPTQGLPATGPYVIASFRPGVEQRFVRNPRFHEWSKAARPDGYPDEIVLTAAGGDQRAVTGVEQGRFDLTLSGFLSPEVLDRLSVRYPERLRTDPIVATLLVALNTTIPPFDSLDARRGVAYALDRAALVRMFGGAHYAQTTCQILPPNFPSYEAYCPFTRDPGADGSWRAPNLEEARRLVARSGTAGARVVVRTAPAFPEQAKYVAGMLTQLGYRATVRVTSDEKWLADAYGPDGTAVQVALTGWDIDFMAPSTFFEQLRCGTLDPARFCNRTIDRQIDQALALQATDPVAADQLWADVDRSLTDQAAWIPYATPRIAAFTGSRLGNFQHHPVWHSLLDQMWVQ
jgi:peptide/nickel transport system substrate-binding protein